MNPSFLLNKLPKYNGTKYLIKKNQDVEDIIKAIIEAHQKHREEYKKIALYFLGRNNEETGRNIWNFLKKNIPYQEEPETEQTIKSPTAIIITGMYNLGRNDCKNYSLFTAGILQGLNDLGHKIPYSFRFASYSSYSKTPGHVFVVINPGTKKEIWIDAVLNKFNYKKPYTYSKDKKMMYSINGTSSTIGKPKLILKIALSPARNSFLALVGLNFLGLAKKLRMADTKAPAKLKIWWEKLGGRYQTLLNNIKKGEKKKRLLGIETMGAEPVTLATLIASASAIIASIGKFLKENGIDPDKLLDVGKKALIDKAKQVIANKEEMADIETEKADDILTEAGAGTSSSSDNLKKYLPLVVIGGAAAFFLLRKK